MPGSSRIGVDFDSVLDQVARLGELASELARNSGQLARIKQTVAEGWSDPMGQQYLSTSEILADKVRGDVEDMLRLPQKFQAWVAQWRATIERNLENAMKLPE